MPLKRTTTPKKANPTKLSRGKVPSKPPAQTAFTSPSVRAYVSEWTLALIRSAEMQADTGNLRAAASLCEVMLGDDRVRGCLQEARIKGLLGLPLSFEPGAGRGKNAPVRALEAGEDWWEIFPEDKLAELKTWGILLGVGLARATWELVPRKSGTRLLATLEIIHPSAIRWDEQTRQWFVTDASGREQLVTPGDGTWILYTPYGASRPWARGAWRALARYWLSKQYAVTDWMRYSERHGQGLFVGLADKDSISTEEDRKALANDLASLGREKAIALPPGYSLQLVEATAKTYETFRDQIGQADTAIAVCILGQNLSTEVQGGSFAAASVHATVKAQIIAGDAETLSTCLHDQVLIFWAEWNFGSASLAPWPQWDTSQPEDLTSTVNTWNTAGAAITTWQNLGAPVDVAEAARKVGLPLVDGAEIQPPQPQQGLVVNARGEVIGRLRSFARPKATSGQAYADSIVDAGRDASSDALSPTIEDLLGIIESAKDFESLKAALVASYGASPDFETIIERALVLAELAGRAAVNEEL